MSNTHTLSQKIRRAAKHLLVVVAIGGGLLMIAPPAHAFVDPFKTTPEGGGGGASCKPGGGFLAFAPWYKYLKGKTQADSNGQSACRPYISQPGDIWFIVAAIFEDLLFAAGIAAVGYVIWGSFQYIMSQGAPDRIASAKSTLTNAIIGLVLTVMAGRIIGFIAARFAGGSGLFGLPKVTANTGALHTILSVVFELAGAIAVLFVVWGGVTYARSEGDPGTIKQAKDTILYALVGLALAIFAQVIVGFVLSKT